MIDVNTSFDQHNPASLSHTRCELQLTSCVQLISPLKKRYNFFPRHGCFFLLHHIPIYLRTLVMATTPAKRKRALEDHSTLEPPSSKQKPTRTSSDYFVIRGVLQYKNGKYLVDWEDNPDTGEKYSPTWEPKKNLNEEALQDWKETQAKQRAEKKKALKLKNSKKRVNDSQQSYDETTPASTRERPRKRPRVLESSPTSDSSVTAEVKDTSGGSTVPQKAEESAQNSTSLQASDQLGSGSSDEQQSEGKLPRLATESSSPETRHDLRAKGLEVQLSPKSIDHNEYTSFSAPATQTSATNPASPAQPFVAEKEVSIENEQSSSTDGLTQEIPDSTRSHIKSFSRESAPPSPAPQPLSISTVEFSEEPTQARIQERSQDSVTSEPTTNSRPSHENYQPAPTTLTQTTTETRPEETESGPNSLYQTSPAKVNSCSPEKLVPDSQGLEKREVLGSAENRPGTGGTQFSTTSEGLKQDQKQYIPESSPIEVLPSYLCFHAWKDQHIFVHAKIRRD